MEPGNFNFSGPRFTQASNGNCNVIDPRVSQLDFASNPVYNSGLPSHYSVMGPQMNICSQLLRNEESHYLLRQSNDPQRFQRIPQNWCLPTLGSRDLYPIRNSIPNHSQIFALKQIYKDQQQILLAYHHATVCSSRRTCNNSSCAKIKKLIHHMKSCHKSCEVCNQLCYLLRHHQDCQNTACIVCVPVRKRLFFGFGAESSQCKTYNSEPSSKRLKMKDAGQTSEMVNTRCKLSPEERLSFQSCKTVIDGSSGEVKLYENSSQGSHVLGYDLKFDDSTGHLQKKCVPFESFGHTSEMVNEFYESSPREQLSGYSCKTLTGGSSGEVMKPLENSFQGSPMSECELKFDDSPNHLLKKCLPFESFSQTSEAVKEFCELSPGEQLSGYSCKTVIGGSSAELMKSFGNSSQESPISGCQVKFDDSDATDDELAVNSRLLASLKPCKNQPKVDSIESCKIKKQDLEVSKAENEVSNQVDLMELGDERQQVSRCNDSERREKREASVSPVDCDKKPKYWRQEIKGVSLMESFTLEQVIAHMKSLKECALLGKSKAMKKQSLEQLDENNSCQLCGMGTLPFEAPPIYCVKCFSRIKHKRAYHTMSNCDGLKNRGSGRLYLCNPCFKGSHGDSVKYSGGVLSKSKLIKRRNDVEVLELWVECGKCKGWQHQICALFNAKRNVGGQARYTCPKCQVEEIESGRWKPLPDGAILGARDLPKSKLSDHIEQRLVLKLARERQERADMLQMNFNDVPSAEDLTVRVVSSVNKKTEVKQIFRQIFEGKSYPPEFPYKSKAILLFQKIEGADVCLFAIYVQEYGSSCSKPNERRICLSYLDSVKYFRPDVKCVTGEALRTFVYHEILIGYLDYSKKRGFTSCHIWSCPPLKQEDFILNCHPELQKTPKLDKLREWYLAMIRKASKDNIVEENTKLYDFFFTPSEGGQTSLTAARLPYFDGDYWPGYAEEFLESLQQIEDGKEPEKKGRMTISKRALKPSRYCSSNNISSKDSLLMCKLGEVLRPMKDDLIVIHLQHPCSHCGQMILAGKRWVCDQCKRFQLCDKCHDADQSRGEEARHPVNNAVKHSFHSVDVAEVPVDTDDGDKDIQSEFFDSRIAFLNLCQGNHYQYDTLRRAKHSTMMILYHLHNPNIPAYVVSCIHCHVDIDQGHGWHCEKCPDYDLCASCYCQHGNLGHPHELVPQTLSSQGAVPEKTRSGIQILLELLVHASKCSAPCKVPSCQKVKGLFQHGSRCKIRISGGCISCKKIWYILKLHVRSCKENDECLVPRCRDLKEHMRKIEAQSDFRCRFAAMEERKKQLKQPASEPETEESE